MRSASSRLVRRVAIAGPPIIVLLFAALTLAGLRSVGDSRRAVERTYRVAATTRRLLARLVDAETATRGYIITGDDSYLAPMAGVEQDVRVSVRELRALIMDPAQQARLDTLAPLVAARLATLDSVVAVRRAGPLTTPSRSGVSTTLMQEIRTRVAVMNEAQERLLVARRAKETRRSELVEALLVIGSLLSGGLALLVNYVFAHHAAEQEEKNLLLQEQAVELEAQAEELGDQNQRLQDQAAELEAQTVELEEAVDAVRESEEGFH